MTSRVQRRSGTKSLVCSHCIRAVKNKQNSTPRNIGSFRGTSQARLNKHINDVHIHPRTVRPDIPE